MAGRGIHRFALFLVASTLFLIFAGGLVTSTGSGLAVPDWPKSYGMWWPPMVGGVFYEHGHRTVAATVALLTIVMAATLHFGEPRRWVRRLGLLAVAMVVLQGILGGLTVILLLPLPISVGHACLAQAFLCLVVTLAVVTSRAWAESASPLPTPRGATPRAIALASTIAIFGQLVLGAVVRHMAKDSIDHDGPRVAIPDFPLAFGRIVPEASRLADPSVAVHFAHRIGAVAVAALALTTAARTRALHPASRSLRLLGSVLGLAVAAQLTLGALTVWSDRAVLPTTLHVVTGALVLATSMALTLLLHPRQGDAPEPVAELQAA